MGTRIPILSFSEITKWKSCEMNIIDMWISDATFIIVLDDDDEIP